MVWTFFISKSPLMTFAFVFTHRTLYERPWKVSRKDIFKLLLTYIWVCLDWAYFCWNWKHCNEIIFKCVNSTVEPIFNKKLLKSVICGTVNSARMHCSQLIKSTITGWKKKKKRRGKRRGETQTQVSLQSKQSHYRDLDKAKLI